MSLIRGRMGDAAIAALFAAAAVLAVIWLVRSADRDEAASSAERENLKLEKAAKLVADNQAVVFLKQNGTAEGNGMAGKSAISIVREVAESCGISENLIRVIPEENRKKGEVTAQVVLKGVKINDLVNFLVQIRTRYPAIRDREARLRLAGRAEDSWDAGLALTYGQ